MPKLLIFDAFTLLIREKNVAIYALLRCKIFSLKIWVCKILDKFHVCNIPLKNYVFHFRALSQQLQIDLVSKLTNYSESAKWILIILSGKKYTKS